MEEEQMPVQPKGSASEQNDQQAQVPKLPKQKSKLLSILIAATLIITGGAVAYMQFIQKDEAPQQQASEQTQADDNQPTGVPRVLAYSKTKNPAGEADGLYWRNVEGGEETLAKKFDETAYVGNFGSQGTSVYAVVSIGTSEQVWYSFDEGKSYSMVFEGQSAEDQNGLGTQVSSLVFSQDESSLLIGIVLTDGTEEVHEVTLNDKKSSLLFKPDGPVLLKGYDRQNGKVYYLQTKCWNCDGGIENVVQIYDTVKKSGSSWTNPYNELEDIVINAAYTEALVRTGVQGDELGLGAPFGLYQLDLGTLTTTTIEENAERFSRIAYDFDNKALVFYEGKLFAAGSTSPMYETADTIRQVLFVHGDDILVTTIGNNTGKVIRYNKATNTPTTLVQDASIGGIVVTYLR